MANVEILTIGNELLDGRILNGNALFLNDELTKAGFNVRQNTTVSDQITEIVRALSEAWNRADIILTTGGLGPTHCDLTTESITKFLGTELEYHQVAYNAMLERFKSRNIVMTDNNIKQAYIPKGANLILNQNGTAPGFDLQKENHYLAAMPGVPHEMKYMFLQQILPQLLKIFPPEPYYFHIWRTTGLAESKISADLENFNWLPKDSWLSLLSTPYGINIQIQFPQKTSASVITEVINRIDSKIKASTYSNAYEDLENIVGNMLAKKHLTIAVAESCTGGLVLNRLTNVSGSSQYVIGGEVVYSNLAKIKMGVSSSTLEKFGAVSAECALEMASAIRHLANSNIGLATTGIAGPTGETPLKPLGLVYVAYSDECTSEVRQYIFKDERLVHKQRTSQACLALLWKHLSNKK